MSYSFIVKVLRYSCLINVAVFNEWDKEMFVLSLGGFRLLQSVPSLPITEQIVDLWAFLWSKIFVLHSSSLTEDNSFSFSKVLSHTLRLPVQTCSLSWAKSVSPFHFLLFPLPLDPSQRLQCWHSPRPNLPALIIFLLCCSSIFLSNSLVVDVHISLPLFCVCLFWVIELTPSLLSLYVLMTAPLSHTHTSKPDASALFLFRRALLRDFSAVGMCLIQRGLWEVCFSQAAGVQGGWSYCMSPYLNNVWGKLI